MSSKVIKRCPHCAYTYQNGGSKRYYGSPLRKCTKCEKEFVDKGGIEIAISGIRDSDKSIIDGGILLAVLMGIVLVGFGIYLQELITTIAGVFFVWCTIYGIYDKIKNYAKHLEELEKEKRDSFRRLSDIRYAQKLKGLGYHVSGKFLMSVNETPEADVPSDFYRNSYEESVANNKKQSKSGAAVTKYSKIHKIILGITSFLSIILYIKTINEDCYPEAMLEITIGVIIASVLYVLYRKSRNRRSHLGYISRMASISVFVILLMYNVLYYTKVERVMNAIPEDKVITVRVDLEGECYSESALGTKRVKSDRCGMKIDGSVLFDGEVKEIMLDQSKIERISCSNNGDGGYIETSIVISGSMLSGDTMIEELELESGDLAKVFYSFEREVTFWEVIFY